MVWSTNFVKCTLNFSVKYDVFVHQQNNSRLNEPYATITVSTLSLSQIISRYEEYIGNNLFCYHDMGQAQESQTRSIGSFTGVKAEEGIDVFLKKGTKESVRVEVSGTSLENVITEVSGSYLKVHMRSGDYRGSVNAKVYVTYVKIDKVSASSAGSVFSEGSIETDVLELSASSAGNVDLTIKAGTVEVSASSAGEVDLNGTANYIIAEASSAGEIDAYDLAAKKV